MDLMKTRLFISIESEEDRIHGPYNTHYTENHQASDYGNMVTLWPMAIMGKNKA